MKTTLATRAQELIAQQLSSIRLKAVRRGLRIPPTSGFSYRVVTGPTRQSPSRRVEVYGARVEMSKLRSRFRQ